MSQVKAHVGGSRNFRAKEEVFSPYAFNLHLISSKYILIESDMTKCHELLKILQQKNENMLFSKPKSGKMAGKHWHTNICLQPFFLGALDPPCIRKSQWRIMLPLNIM